MIKAIIFDLDGTVLNTLLDLKTAVNRVMNLAIVNSLMRK